MRDFVELYIDECGYNIMKLYSTNNDKYLLAIDPLTIEECNIKNISCIDLDYEQFWLDGDYNIDIHLDAIEEKAENIIKVISKYKKVLLIGKIHHGIDCSIYVLVSQLCKKMNIECDAIVILPFGFEGKNAKALSLETINIGNVNTVISIDSEDLKPKIAKETPMFDAFAYIDYLVCELIKCYEENDIYSHSISIHRYNKIIDAFDEKWIEKTRDKMREKGELWEQRK